MSTPLGEPLQTGGQTWASVPSSGRGILTTRCTWAAPSARISSLQVGFADVEAETFISARPRFRAEAGRFETARELTLLGCVAHARKPEVEPCGPK